MKRGHYYLDNDERGIVIILIIMTGGKYHVRMHVRCDTGTLLVAVNNRSLGSNGEISLVEKRSVKQRIDG